MKLRYAEVTAIECQERDLFGFHHGLMVSRHPVALTQVSFSGGYRFFCLAKADESGTVVANGYQIAVGDTVRLMALPCGTVVNFVPEGIAHLPSDMALAAFTNPELGKN